MSTRHIVAFAACAFGALAAPAAACTGTLPAAQVAAISSIAQRTLSAMHVSGMSIGVGRRGQVLFACGYGLRDRARRLPSDAATVYPVGSITKQFTASLVMQLAAAGKVDIDALLATYLPGAPHAREITVRDLLDQTSGLADYADTLPEKNPAGPLWGLSDAQYVARIAGKPLQFRPGSKFRYSNTNYLLLGMLVARLTGGSYERALRTGILEPQSLLATTYLHRLTPPGADAAHGYDYAKGAFVTLPDMSMAWANSAGALASNVSDLIRWDGAFFGGRVVGADAVRTMTTAPKLSGPPSNVALLRGYAFGWVIGEGNGRTVIWHNGGVLGGRAMNATFPATGLEVIVLTNVTTAATEKVALAVARALGD
ncbi:MAG TPA: serine hydrolase domain-containing protein [Candidatus Elarobacter sp.]|jgi:CubicO group peptidase (beta-lactamase class C family)|nr:serine hydrolase domain-containing protein [Candidatus Elarobacter sp.]